MTQRLKYVALGRNSGTGMPSVQSNMVMTASFCGDVCKISWGNQYGPGLEWPESGLGFNKCVIEEKMEAEMYIHNKVFYRVLKILALAQNKVFNNVTTKTKHRSGFLKVLMWPRVWTWTSLQRPGSSCTVTLYSTSQDGWENPLKDNIIPKKTWVWSCYWN